MYTVRNAHKTANIPNVIWYARVVPNVQCRIQKQMPLKKKKLECCTFMYSWQLVSTFFYSCSQFRIQTFGTIMYILSLMNRYERQRVVDLCACRKFMCQLLFENVFERSNGRQKQKKIFFFSYLHSLYFFPAILFNRFIIR